MMCRKRNRRKLLGIARLHWQKMGSDYQRKSQWGKDKSTVSVWLGETMDEHGQFVAYLVRSATEPTFSGTGSVQRVCGPFWLVVMRMEVPVEMGGIF